MTERCLRRYLGQSPDRKGSVWFAVSSERRPDFFSAAIEAYQGTTYSHALAIYYSDDFGDYVVANARGQASQLDSLEQFHVIDEVEHLFEKKTSQEERQAFLNKVLEMDGIDYGEMQIVDLSLFTIFGAKPDENGLNHIICSEYADRLAISAGLPSVAQRLGKSIEIISPQDCVFVWRELSKEREDFKIIK